MGLPSPGTPFSNKGILMTVMPPLKTSPEVKNDLHSDSFQTPAKSNRFTRGYVQVYTGNGKGKTTAAIGLAMRAAGAGLKVIIVQFMKSGNYSEIKALEKYSGHITVEQYGTGKFLTDRPTEMDLSFTAKGLYHVKAAASSGKYQVIILEEANMAVLCGLLSVDDLLDVIETRRPDTEIVITGRYAHPKIIDAADLVTEMKEVKHYYTRGIQARTGIEK